MDFFSGLVEKTKNATGFGSPGPTIGGRRRRRGGKFQYSQNQRSKRFRGGNHLGTSNSSLGHSTYRGGSSLKYGPYKGGKGRKSRKSRKK